MQPLPVLEYSQRQVFVEKSARDSQLALLGETRVIWTYRPKNTSRNRRQLAFLHRASHRTGGQVGRSMLCPDTAGSFLSAGQEFYTAGARGLFDQETAKPLAR